MRNAIQHILNATHIRHNDIHIMQFVINTTRVGIKIFSNYMRYTTQLLIYRSAEQI